MSEQKQPSARLPPSDGLELVPAVPTQAMLNAARDWSAKKYGKPIGNDAAEGCWQAMLLAAAPAAQSEAMEPVKVRECTMDPDEIVDVRCCLSGCQLKAGFASMEGMPTGWISVDERLPEERVRVLAFGPRCWIEDCFYGVGTNRNRGGWSGKEWRATGTEEYRDITHWMPLPKPPASSDRNKERL